MIHERRKAKRVPCRIPAAVPAGPALIRDMSTTGARVFSSVTARIGDRLPLQLVRRDGQCIRLEGAVRRVRPNGRLYDIGCSFDAHAASSVAAWKLAKTVAAGPVEFLAPPSASKPVSRRRHSWSLGDYFTIEGLFFLVLGVTVLLLASIVAVGYFGLR